MWGWTALGDRWEGVALKRGVMTCQLQWRAAYGLMMSQRQVPHLHLLHPGACMVSPCMHVVEKVRNYHQQQHQISKESPLILIVARSVPESIRDLRSFKRRDSIFLSFGERSGMIAMSGVGASFLLPLMQDGLNIAHSCQPD